MDILKKIDNEPKKNKFIPLRFRCLDDLCRYKYTIENITFVLTTRGNAY